MSAPQMRGVGDRWLHGERIAGITFALHDAVEIVDGRHAGKHGIIALLLGVEPEPGYLVQLSGGGDARVKQSALRATA